MCKNCTLLIKQTKMKDLDRLVEWFKKRVSVHKYEEHHLKFIMTEYAKIYHAEQLALCDVSQQRELLESFRDFVNKNPNSQHVYNYDISDYLKTI